MFGKKDPSKSPRETGGPVVKTGPTRGENRSRNDSGEWRKKRSDAGSTKKKSGCFLTTAACQHKGLPDDCRELQVLRRFRDEVLLSTSEGRALVGHYYRVAPAIVAELSAAADLDYVWSTVQKCVAEIEARDFYAAVLLYRSMTEELALRYELALPPQSPLYSLDDADRVFQKHSAA